MRSVLRAVVTLVLGVMVAGAAIAQDGYRIQPGDVLAVEVLQDPSLSREVLVTPDGSFNFPFVGAVRASNRTPSQVASTIADGIASNFAAPPNVFVSVRRLGAEAAAIEEEAATITVFFMGEVANPGARAVPVGTTFLQALSQSGGLTTFAAERRIQIRRTNTRTLEQTLSTVDYRALSRGARLDQDIVLADGDVILVPQRRLFE